MSIGNRLILATHNAGKVAEMGTLLDPLGITVVSAAALNLDEPEETETTFEGNAALKAEAASKATGLPALSDDSGLAVHALGGDPGVYSARWAGPERDFAMAMARVLDALSQKSSSERGASFISVLALAVPGETTRLFEGRVDGTIATIPRGTHGFGYDPIFIPQEGDGRTFGEMTAEEKSGGAAPLSHRARAIAKFLAAMADGGTDGRPG
ncbi:MAG: RdgB/HAM1 family non-canonical purine NTP pyrophosphatase [Pseudomonadota bacterium]